LPVINLERRNRRTGWLLIRAAIGARAQSKAPLTEPRHTLPNGWPAPCRHRLVDLSTQPRRKAGATYSALEGHSQQWAIPAREMTTLAGDDEM
jgi:hypothetical protein